MIPSGFFHHITRWVQEAEAEFYEMIVIFFKSDDMARKLPHSREFMESMSALLFYNIRAHFNAFATSQISVKIILRGSYLQRVLKIVGNAHFSKDSTLALLNYQGLTYKSVDLDTLLQLDVNQKVVYDKPRNYMYIMESLIYFMSENLYTMTTDSRVKKINIVTTFRKIIKDSSTSVKKITTDPAYIRTHEKGYSKFARRLQLVQDLTEYGILDESQETISQFFKSLFNQKTLNSYKTADGRTLLEWMFDSSSGTPNWQILSSYSSRYSSLTPSQKLHIAEIFYWEASPKGKIDIWRQLLQPSDIGFVKAKYEASKIFIKVAKFGQIRKTPDKTIFPVQITDDRTSHLRSYFTDIINIFTEKFGGFELYPRVDGKDNNRFSKFLKGERTITMNEIWWMENVINYFVTHMFNGNNDLFNQFLAKSWAKYFNNPSGKQYPFELVQFTPFKKWAVNHLSAEGYAGDDLSFHILLGGKSLLVQCHSKAEKQVIQKLMELDSFQEIGLLVDAKKLMKLYHSKKNLFVEYVGIDGKKHYAQFDIGITFVADGGRGIFFEILGYAEQNAWDGEYGLNKDLAALVALAKGFANIYVPCYDTAKLLDFYLNDPRIATIGKKMPFLSRAQLNFMIDRMKELKIANPTTASQIGLEQTIGRLHESLPVGSPKYHQARAIQIAFGMKVDSSGNVLPITFDANGHIETSCITSNFQKWWGNFWNSNVVPSLPINNLMYSQIHS